MHRTLQLWLDAADEPSLESCVPTAKRTKKSRKQNLSLEAKDEIRSRLERGWTHEGEAVVGGKTLPQWTKLGRKRNSSASKTAADYIYVSDEGIVLKTLRELKEIVAASPRDAEGAGHAPPPSVRGAKGTKGAKSAKGGNRGGKGELLNRWVAEGAQPVGLCCSPAASANLLRALHDIAFTSASPATPQSEHRAAKSCSKFGGLASAWQPPSVQIKTLRTIPKSLLRRIGGTGRRSRGDSKRGKKHSSKGCS